MSITSINPATGNQIRSFAPYSEEKLDKKLEKAWNAFQDFRRVPVPERKRIMKVVAEILEREREMFARLMTAEMGKIFRSALEECGKCAWACRYFADSAERWLADEVIKTDGDHASIHYEPLGPVLAIMPWNFPFWQVTRFAAAALMAGNVVLLKHASNVPQCALAIEDVLRMPMRVETSPKQHRVPS